MRRIKETINETNIRESNYIAKQESKIHKILSHSKETTKERIFDNAQMNINHMREVLRLDHTEFGKKIIWWEDQILKLITEEKNIQDKRHELRAQEMYDMDPKKAMRHFVVTKDNPECKIEIPNIEAHFNNQYEIPRENEIDQNNDWISERKINKDIDEEMMRWITNEDNIKHVIITRNRFSAKGLDGIPNIIFQLDTKNAVKHFQKINELIWKHRKLPTIWNECKTLLFYKKDDPTQMKNWRPITITSTAYRIFMGTLSNCLQDINKGIRFLSEQQKGFIKGVNGTMEHSMILKEIMTDARRNRKDIHICTIDFADAFGSINKKLIRKNIENIGFPNSFSELINNVYRNNQTRVFTGEGNTNAIKLNVGVKQGCPLSPMLFNIALNPLIERIHEMRMERGYLSGDNQALSIQAFADDIVLISGTQEGMNTLLRTTMEYCRYSGLKINASKCKNISIIQDKNKRVIPREAFTIDGNTIEQIYMNHNTEYLGAKLNNSGRTTIKNTTNILNEMKTLVSQICKSPLRINQKLHAIRTFALPALNHVLIVDGARSNDLKDVNRHIRTELTKVIGGPNLPKEVFYTHWKDGGFSIINLKQRKRALCISTMAKMVLNTNTNTRNIIEYTCRDELRHRKIEIERDNL